MHIKIRNGTVQNDGSSLCETCSHSTIVRGRTLDEEMVHCDALVTRLVRVTFKVTSCSDYQDSRLPSYAQLMEQAWILQPGSKRRAAGFIRAADLKEEEFINVIGDIRGEVKG
jgi:hypothetical protein